MHLLLLTFECCACARWLAADGNACISGLFNHLFSLIACFSLHVQAMDLPLAAWSIIRQSMTPKEWAKICGTSRATFALRRSLVAAEICLEPGDHDQVLLSQLQHEKQPTCHSLFLSLQ